FEDLFEDLDKFFARGNPGSGRRGSGSRAGEASEEEPAEDLLPPGWEPDIEGLDLGSDLAAAARPPDQGRRSSDVEGAAGREPDAARPEPSDADEFDSANPSEDEAPEGVGDDEPEQQGERSVADTEEDLFGYEADDELGEAVAWDTGTDSE